MVQAIRAALKSAGHGPGPIDGVYGAQTLKAVKSYQRAKGLPTGGLTMSTLESLKIGPGR